MKTRDLLQGIQELDEKFIEEARPGSRKQRKKKQLLIVYLAAAIILTAISLPIVFTLTKRSDDLPLHTGAQTEESFSVWTIRPSEQTETETETPTADVPNPSQGRLIAYGLMFEYNMANDSYSLIDIIDKSRNEIIIPEYVDNKPVIEWKNALKMLENNAGSIHFGENMIFIGENAYTFQMENDEFIVDSAQYTYENGCLIEKSTSTLLKARKSAVIPRDGSVKSIAPCALTSLDGTSFEIPEGVVEIRPFAFSGNTQIKTLSLPSTLEKIGNNAFIGCSSLERIDHPDPAKWEKIVFESFFSNPLHIGGRLYVNGTPCISDRAEPDKASDPDAWIDWLINDPFCPASSTYPFLSRISMFSVVHKDTSDPCPWEYFRGHFHLILSIADTRFFEGMDPRGGDSTESGRYTWEILYKKSGSDDSYRSIFTRPWSYYNWGDGTALYRLPTYSAGMTDLSTDNGKPQYYDLVIIIREGGENGTVAGCGCVRVPVTVSYNLFLHDALSDEGAIL